MPLYQLALEVASTAHTTTYCTSMIQPEVRELTIQLGNFNNVSLPPVEVSQLSTHMASAFPAVPDLAALVAPEAEERDREGGSCTK